MTNKTFRCLLPAVLALVAEFACITTAGAQPGPNVNPQFVGQWCVQGDPTRIGSIASSGLGLQLTNESGSTSIAQPVGPSGQTIVALQWNLVQGTLTPDASRITWTNGTFGITATTAAAARRSMERGTRTAIRAGCVRSRSGSAR